MLDLFVVDLQIDPAFVYRSFRHKYGNYCTLTNLFDLQGLTKTGDDYEVKAAHVELAERMRKVGGNSGFVITRNCLVSIDLLPFVLYMAYSFLYLIFFRFLIVQWCHLITFLTLFCLHLLYCDLPTCCHLMTRMVSIL